MTTNHALHLTWFLQALRTPARSASLFQASRELAAAMADGTVGTRDPSTLRVIEAGMGYGAVTRGLLDRGVNPDCLVGIDVNRAALAMPAVQALGIRTLAVDARYTDFLARDLGWGTVDAVCSSLGLRAMPADVVQAIFEAAHRALAPGGRFVQYTYGWASPDSLGVTDQLGWTLVSQRRVWRNLPMATVRVYETPRG